MLRAPRGEVHAARVGRASLWRPGKSVRIRHGPATVSGDESGIRPLGEAREGAAQGRTASQETGPLSRITSSFEREDHGTARSASPPPRIVRVFDSGFVPGAAGRT